VPTSLMRGTVLLRADGGKGRAEVLRCPAASGDVMAQMLLNRISHFEFGPTGLSLAEANSEPLLKLTSGLYDKKGYRLTRLATCASRQRLVKGARDLGSISGEASERPIQVYEYAHTWWSGADACGTLGYRRRRLTALRYADKRPGGKAGTC
jgi:hypothetical protein